MSGDVVVLIVGNVILLGATVEAVRLIRLGRRSLGWPTAKGKVISLEVIPILRGNRMTYRPTINYRYQVKGREYQGDRLAVAFNFVMMKTFESVTLHGASSMLDGYYPGAPVAVYYDPDRPQYSVLKPGASRGLYLIGFTTAAALVAFTGMWTFFVPR